MDAANNYLNSISTVMSVDYYSQREDLRYIPCHDKMGTINKTILRCSESTFKINYSEMNHLKVATMKQMKVAN